MEVICMILKMFGRLVEDRWRSLEVVWKIFVVFLDVFWKISGSCLEDVSQVYDVFWKIVEILEKHKPEMIILENVKNLKSHDKGKTYQVIEEKLQDCGYNIKTAILDTSKIIGVPQHRERIYIVGFRDKKKYDNFNFDFAEKKIRKISDFLEDQINFIDCKTRYE